MPASVCGKWQKKRKDIISRDCKGFFIIFGFLCTSFKESLLNGFWMFRSLASSFCCITRLYSSFCLAVSIHRQDNTQSIHSFQEWTRKKNSKHKGEQIASSSLLSIHSSPQHLLVENQIVNPKTLWVSTSPFKFLSLSFAFYFLLSLNVMYFFCWIQSFHLNVVSGLLGSQRPAFTPALCSRLLRINILECWREETVSPLCESYWTVT